MVGQFTPEQIEALEARLQELETKLQGTVAKSVEVKLGRDLETAVAELSLHMEKKFSGLVKASGVSPSASVSVPVIKADAHTTARVQLFKTPEPGAESLVQLENGTQLQRIGEPVSVSNKRGDFSFIRALVVVGTKVLEGYIVDLYVKPNE